MESLENAIISLIQTALPTEAKVLAWPDSALKTGRPQGSAAILVRYAAMALRPAEATGNRGPIVQEGYIEIEIRFLVKSLREHAGAYPLMAAVRLALGNWKPNNSDLPDCVHGALKGFYLVQENLLRQDPKSALWDWGQKYRFEITQTMGVKRG